jgi:ubiquinone/menaquinone biosynthesis C-methylase UbiE
MSETNILTKQNIEQIFDGAAESYDRRGPAIFDGFVEVLVRDIPTTQGMNALDIATGKGAVLCKLVKRIGIAGHLVGIDVSNGILNEAHHIIESEAYPNVELLKMDAEHHEFADQCFDIFTCAFALFMFPNMKLALREMYRVCKPGGYIALTNFSNSPSPFEPGWPIFAKQSKEYNVALRMPQRLGMASL